MFYLCCFAFFPCKLGLTRSINLMTEDPLLWIIILAMSGSGFVFFLVLAFPPTSWRARIEFTHEKIRYFPKPPLRWIGEPTTEVRIGADVREIIICSGSQDHYDGSVGPSARQYPWGYRIVIRPESGHTQEIKVPTGDRLNARQAKQLADGIATAIGVPVRFVKRELSDTGEQREFDWTPIGPSMNLGCLVKLAFVSTPFVGGIAMGIIHPDGPTVIAVGICLWLLQTLVLFLYPTTRKQWSKFSALYWLTTAVSFSGAYAVIFFVVASFARDR